MDHYHSRSFKTYQNISKIEPTMSKPTNDGLLKPLMQLLILIVLGFIPWSCKSQNEPAPEQEEKLRESIEIPLVFSDEFTGSKCTEPPLPSFGNLASVEKLTNPFEWSDGSGIVNSYDEWKCRRAEIKAELEQYEVGVKPGRPEDINARYANGILTVDVTVNGNTLTLSSEISLPSGNGPFPAIIGMGGPSGSLPADIFSSRDIAMITFNFSQVMHHTQKRGTEPINALYPDLTYIGSYSAWSWGVSRIIDGLELVVEDLPIDLEHLGVSGCSFAGKMALWAGALDERIALTIAQEPGGGGAAAWRVSETLGNVEKIGNTNYAWFIEAMRQFSEDNASKLPMDHHELLALVAPRAVLILGNPDYEWLADESAYVSCQAARRVWVSMDIADRFGYSIVGGHGHCQLPNNQFPEVEAFVDKFMLGDESVNTSFAISPFETNTSEWIDWGIPDLK